MKKFLTGCIIGFLASNVLNKISFSIRIKRRTKGQDTTMIANRYFAQIDSEHYVEVDEKVYEDTKNNTDLPIIHSVLSNENDEEIHYYIILPTCMKGIDNDVVKFLFVEFYEKLGLEVEYDGLG